MNGSGGLRGPIRVMVVDDSETSRAAIERMLCSSDEFSVVGSARDGEEALGVAMRVAPDLVVLDLEMPRMDGFTFLRLLMAQRPTAVVVVSSRSRPNQVFKALELGAVDFVPKPEGSESLEPIRQALLEKCEAVAHVEVKRFPSATPRSGPRSRVHMDLEPPRVVLLGASTGGPQAIRLLLSELEGSLPLALVVAQHMPEKFTATFAERLAESTAFIVKEAEEGDVVAVGRVLIAPGGRHLSLRRDEKGVLRTTLEIHDPKERLRYCPSVDALFCSGAPLLRERACAVVLTGMGHDGRAGIREVKAAGGLTLAEAESTAVIYGMPLAAVETGSVDEIVALDALAGRLERFARGA